MHARRSRLIVCDARPVDLVRPRRRRLGRHTRRRAALALVAIFLFALLPGQTALAAPLGAWFRADSMSQDRANHTMTLIPSGRYGGQVLVAGGGPSTSGLSNGRFRHDRVV
jgi:hypothetical protein